MGDEDDYVCEVNLKDAPISITHHLEVLGEYFDGLKNLGKNALLKETFFTSKPVKVVALFLLCTVRSHLSFLLPGDSYSRHFRFPFSQRTEDYGVWME